MDEQESEVVEYPLSIYVPKDDQELDVKELITHFIDLPESIIRFYPKENKKHKDLPYPKNEEEIDELLQVVDPNWPIELYIKFTHSNGKIEELMGLGYIPGPNREEGMGYKAIEIRMRLNDLTLLNKVCTMSQLPNFPKECFVREDNYEGYTPGKAFFTNLDGYLYNKFIRVG